MAINRVDFGGETLIDISDTTATAPDVQAGRVFYLSSGARSIGTGTGNIRFGTTQEWNSQVGLISEQNVVYVYTDHHTNQNGDPVPGFKIGDGLAYLVDLPFNDDICMEHINNSSVHVTQAEKDFWNNKVTAFLNAESLETLVLTKN